jgi:alpha-methylacyl-CoA racemase
MTGWGQDGPYAQMAGHDINYIALSGTLSLIGRDEGPPAIPVNLIGDYGGGGLLLAFGIACALLEAGRSGQGQVVDAAMIDGAAILAAPHWGMKAGGLLGPRGTNVLDGGAPYYNVYETADGKFVTIGAIEPNFYQLMVDLTGLTDDGHGPVSPQDDRVAWPAVRARLAAVIRAKTRDEWCRILEGTDACFAPVLTLDEVADQPHVAARNGIVDIAGVAQPAPAPRFSRTPGAITRPPANAGEHTEEALLAWGFEAKEIIELLESGAIHGPA